MKKGAGARPAPAQGARQRLGLRGEQLAADYLTAKGYMVQKRNYRCPAGEVDLVAYQGEELVFVEVKTRLSRRCGLPEEALTPRKQAHLLHVAQTFLQERGLENSAWRIDVIAVELDRAGNPGRIEQIEHAVRL